MTNCFVIFAKQGFLFDDFGHGGGNMCITQSGADVGPVSVQINKVQEHSGVQFVNCQFMSTIKIGPENEGPVKISNSGFWAIESTTEQIINQGPGTLILNACHFSNWDVKEKGVPCIRTNNGRLILSNCDFMADKNPLLLDQGLTAATITGNIFRQKKIENNSKAKVQMNANIFD